MKILKALLITSLIYPVTLLAESAPTLICPSSLECVSTNINSCGPSSAFYIESASKDLDIGTYTFKTASDLGSGQVMCSYVNESGPTTLELFPLNRIWKADGWSGTCYKSPDACQFIQK